MPTITVMVKVGIKFPEATIIEQLHLPDLNKISERDQQAYLAEIKNCSYESKIRIKWSRREDCVYKNVCLLKLPQCNEKRSSCSRSDKVENKKRKSSVNNYDNEALY